MVRLNDRADLAESCRFKVFVGTRVSEIQELTDGNVWRYVDSARNPADDVTRGKGLRELAKPNRWSQGPPFLLQNPESWPEDPSADQAQQSYVSLSFVVSVWSHRCRLLQTMTTTTLGGSC